MKRERKSHIWDRSDEDWYVEPEWCSQRLFEEEKFSGAIYDPACGMGRILDSAENAGLTAFGIDLVDRRNGNGFVADFLNDLPIDDVENIVTNPPFDLIQPFYCQAAKVATQKIAMICPTARLNAAHKWLEGTPLKRILLLTPRPSMPPGHVILAGQKPGGGKMDYCWLLWDKSYNGEPTIEWLHRDRKA